MRDKSGNYLSVVFETSPSQPRNGSSQPPLTTISDSGFFWPKSLSLSLNLTSLPRSNPKSINFSLSTRFSPNPNLCSLFDLGLKRARGRCECLEVLVSDGELLLFFFFFFADGSELGMLVVVINEVEGDAQSKRGCWKSGGGTVVVERERERRESLIEIQIW